MLTEREIDAIAKRIVDAVLERISQTVSHTQKVGRELVSRKLMAKRLGVSLTTLDRLTSEKRIPSVMVGRRRKFDPALVMDVAGNGIEEIRRADTDNATENKERTKPTSIAP